MSETAPEWLAARFRAEADRAWALEPPGRGATAARFAQLWAWAAEDVALGRLLEAHADAVAIAAEAGVVLRRGTYGVWASEGPGSRLDATVDGDRLHLHGAKRYATGAALVDGALVTAHGPEGLFLVLVGREAFGPLDPGGWRAHAFEGTGTATVRFDAVVPLDAVVGPAGWYLARPGFWHGGVGVAACWAGGAAGLLDHLGHGWSRRDPHSLARLGSADATAWALRAVVDRAAAEIDADPGDGPEAERRSRRVRFLVDRMANEVLDALLRGAGPGPLAFEDGLERRVDELRLYTRQCHGEREVEPVGQHLADGQGA